MSDPMIFCTRKECAFDAYSKAFDAGGRDAVSQPKFETWWAFALSVTWASLKDLTQAAWSAGVQARVEACTAGWDMFWNQSEPPDLGAPIQSYGWLAWSAWQVAFDSGKLLADHAKFETWRTTTGAYPGWKNVREYIESAWGNAVIDRNEQCTAGFSAWWQEILDSQPVIRPGS